MNTANVAASDRSTPRTGFAYLDAVLDQPGSVLAMAHRGGAAHPELTGAENTLHAFRHAVEQGYHYLETDVHASSDGVLMAFHDDVLDRVTDQTGQITTLTALQIAGARIGSEHGVPTMASLLEELPGVRFNIDIKSAGAVAPLAALVEAARAHDRVCVGSFSAARIAQFRRLTHGRVATSAAPAEVAAFLVPGAGRLVRHAQVLQVPHRRGAVPVVTRRLVRRAHAAGLHVHVWTVDEEPEMHELLDLGVDGLITDRTDVLKDVLEARGQWRDHL